MGLSDDRRKVVAKCWNLSSKFTTKFQDDDHCLYYKYWYNIDSFSFLSYICFDNISWISEIHWTSSIKQFFHHKKYFTNNLMHTIFLIFKKNHTCMKQYKLNWFYICQHQVFIFFKFIETCFYQIKVNINKTYSMKYRLSKSISAFIKIKQYD